MFTNFLNCLCFLQATQKIDQENISMLNAVFLIRVSVIFNSAQQASFFYST